jgi:hypothetical protein
MYALGHECVHSAKVSGTGAHYWRDDVAADGAVNIERVTRAAKNDFMSARRHA